MPRPLLPTSVVVIFTCRVQPIRSRDPLPAVKLTAPTGFDSAGVDVSACRCVDQNVAWTVFEPQVMPPTCDVVFSPARTPRMSLSKTCQVVVFRKIPNTADLTFEPNISIRLPAVAASSQIP